MAGKVFHAFDAPFIQDLVTPKDPWYTRRAALGALSEMSTVKPTMVRVVTTARTFEEKAELIEYCLKHKAEGIMVKHIDAPYSAGLRSDAFSKVKFTRTADLVVSKVGVDNKKNAALCYFDTTGELIEVGRCSLIGKDHVTVGDVVEVRYLYIGKGQRLYQPVLLRVRHDKKPPECTKEQLV